MVLALALLAALGYGVASVLQAVVVRRAGSLRAVAGPAYLAGSGLDLAAWACSLLALRRLPEFEVQSVLSMSLAVTALLARPVLGARLGPRTLLGIGLSVPALVVLATSAAPAPSAPVVEPLRVVIALVALPVAALGLVCARACASAPAPARAASACAALAGLAFGGVAVCARAWTMPTGALAGWPQQLAADPLTWGLAGYGVAGMLLFAAALERGDVARVTALLWLVEVAVPALAGVALLGDTVRAGRAVPAMLAVGLALVAALLLAGDGSVEPAGRPLPA